MILQILRSKKFTRRILIALLILIVPAFILWGAGSALRSPVLVGKIEGQKITLDDFEKSRQGVKAQLLLTYYGDYNTLNQILQNQTMINQITWERLIFLNAARKNKTTVNNKDVLSFLSQHPLFMRGNTFDKEIYNYILRNTMSMDPRQFEELIRQNLQIKAFRQSLLENVTVSDKDVLQYYQLNNEKVELSYVLIDKEIFRNKITVSEDTAKKYYEMDKTRFVEPSKVEVEYIELPYADIAQKQSIAGEVEEILPELNSSPSRFKEIAESQGLKYGKPGPFSREDVIPGITFFKQFQDTAFTLQKDEISLPLFSGSEKGSVYILHKTRDIPPKERSFEEVRDDVLKAVTERELLALAETKANDLYARIITKNATLEDISTTLHQKIKTTGPITISSYIENIGPAEELVSSAVENGQGEIMTPITVKKGVLLVRVDNILPLDEVDFANKKEFLRENILLRKQMNAMEIWFREQTSRVKLKKPLEEL